MPLFRRSIIVFSLFAAPLSIHGQGVLEFIPSYQGRELLLDSTYHLGNDSMRFEQLRFYVSGIHFTKEGKTVYQFPKKHYLLDYSDQNSTRIPFDVPMYFDSLHFQLGIDSLTNVSGAFGEDLDPTNGMYWTWQSGYINFKLEGSCSESPARNNQFQFHIGGYQYPYNTLRSISLKASGRERQQVVLDLDRLFQEIELSSEYKVMSPNQAAVRLADLLQKSIVSSEKK
ncbi:MAG: hypothetical protein EP338_13890 [Bacteroidetes bacterium]|nr:MAG: hypothetical protein EP338_13890 [Bacteroidota bacterium]